jgi:PAS domain S-box-containing protein
MDQGIFLTIIGIFAAAIGKLWADQSNLMQKWRDSVEAHRKCTVESAIQSGEITLLKQNILTMDKDLKRLSLLTHSIIPYATVTCTLESSIIDASDEIKGLLGWRPAELVNKNLDILIPEDYKEKYHKIMNRIKVDADLVSADILVKGFCLHRDKSRVPVLISFNNLIEVNGERLVKAQLFNTELP